MDQALDELNQKLDALSAQVAYLAEQAQQAERAREARDELLQDAMPIARRVMERVSDEMVEVQEYLEVEDLVRLLKKLVGHTPQIEMLLDQLDSLTDLLEVMGPITREGMDKLTGVLSDLERKGYFRLFQDGAQLADRVAVSLAREETAPPLETSLFGLLRQMQDPAVRRGLALTLHLLKVVGEQAAVEGKTQKGK